ncbi:hypothetical protein Tco_0616423 [Tanacetum coccineum]
MILKEANRTIQLPRSFSTNMLDDAGGREQASGGGSSASATQVSMADIERYMIQRQIQQLQASESRKNVPRSCSAGMGRIDEDRASSFRDDTFIFTSTDVLRDSRSRLSRNLSHAVVVDHVVISYPFELTLLAHCQLLVNIRCPPVGFGWNGTLANANRPLPEKGPTPATTIIGEILGNPSTRLAYKRNPLTLQKESNRGVRPHGLQCFKEYDNCNEHNITKCFKTRFGLNPLVFMYTQSLPMKLRNLQAGGEYEDKDKDFEDIRRSPYNDKDTEDIRRYS